MYQLQRIVRPIQRRERELEVERNLLAVRAIERAINLALETFSTDLAERRNDLG
jgi:hypothetical protein